MRKGVRIISLDSLKELMTTLYSGKRMIKTISDINTCLATNANRLISIPLPSF